MIIDQVMGGLKEHLRAHFIKKEFTTLNELKEEVIPYDTNIGLSQRVKEKAKHDKTLPKDLSSWDLINNKTLKTVSGN
jgi:hypothetical protein